MRFAPKLLVLLPALMAALMACDPPDKGGDTTGAGPAAKPATQVVVRSVTIEKTIKGRAPSGGVELESWSAMDGHVYTVVTADLVHNKCAPGDKIDTKNASLIVPGADQIAIAGGGATARDVCVMCQPSEPLNCSGGSAEMRPYTFVFSVSKDADVTKAKLRYQGQEAPLADAKLTDRRGNDKIDKQIQAKEQQIARLQKKLEGTGSVPAGKLILGEMAEIKQEIETLKSKRK
jgi:hypothetical protein